MVYTREQALERAEHAYASFYDLEPEEGEEFLVLKAQFHMQNQSYFLIKQAQMWEVRRDEYMYFYSVPHLTREIYEKCLKDAQERASEFIHPDSQHMSSYIVAAFLCDSCEEDARKALKKCRIRKSFQFSLKGWMEVHTVLADLGQETVTSNADGCKAGEFMKKVLYPRKGIMQKLLQR